MSDQTQTEEPQGESADQQQPDTSTGQDGGKKEAESVITQEQLNKVAGKSREEGREAGRKALLEELGIPDLKELKTVVEYAKEQKQAQMSEIEKAEAKIAEAEKRAQEAERAKAELESKIQADARKQAFLKAVRSSGATNEDDLFILVLAKQSDEFNKVFDGTTADEKQMKAFIKQVQGDFPAYFGSAGAGSPSNSGGELPSPHQDEKTMKEMVKRFGRI